MLVAPFTPSTIDAIHAAAAKVARPSDPTWMRVRASWDTRRKIIDLTHGYIPRAYRHTDEQPGVEDTDGYRAFEAWGERLDSAMAEVEKLLKDQGHTGWRVSSHA